LSAQKAILFGILKSFAFQELRTERARSGAPDSVRVFLKAYLD